MMTGKGVKSKFTTLATRNLQDVQIQHLKERFELAEKSVLAETAVKITNQALDNYEQRTETIRLKPGEMVVEVQGEKLILSLANPQWLNRLGELSLKEVKRHHEHDQFQLLKTLDPQATYGDLWRITGTSQVRKRAPKEYDFLPEEPLDSSTVELLPRRLADLADPPKEVLTEATGLLVNDYGLKPGQAEAMVKVIVSLRAWICPEVNELNPGQAVWLAYSTRRTKRGGPRLLVPLILTLVTPNETELTINHRGEYKTFKMAQIERITTEAWRQDGVLTNTEVEWLLGLTSTTIRQLLEAYQEQFGMILPTAGTILDMGRTLTHKKIVVEMSLSGLTTNEISKRIYHTPEAVDNYLRTFDRLLILKYYEMPLSAVVRVMGCGQKLIEEHLALAEKHFPDVEALVKYLKSRGIALEDAG